MIDQLILLSTYLIAISLATERLVALIKSFVPWLAIEKHNADGLIDLSREKWRIAMVQIISLLAAWTTTSLLNNSVDPFDPICLSKDGTCWPSGVIALLSTGGSAFWNQVLGYVTAVKDIKRQQRVNQRMHNIDRGNERGVPLERIAIN